jgi:tripartite-type tricarboxylate transporter receptor subunit TctC
MANAPRGPPPCGGLIDRNSAKNNLPCEIALMILISFTRLVALACLSCMISLQASAQAKYPEKPIKIIVPFAPGGQPDLVARALAEPLGKALGGTVIVENKPGAGGNIAADFVAKSNADGYTLLMGTNGPLAVSPTLSKTLPYNPERDLTPITLVGTSPNLIAVNPSLGVSTLAEFTAKAKSMGNKLNYASVGKGSISQLTMELLNSVAGLSMQHIPYNGGAPATQAVIAGDVPALALNPTALISQMKAGKIKVLAQTSAKRSPLIADIPTVAESGFAGFEADVWMVVAAPGKTPPAIIQQLNKELTTIIKSAEMKKLFDAQWIEPFALSPTDTAKVIKQEREKWERVIRAAGIETE